MAELRRTSSIRRRPERCRRHLPDERFLCRPSHAFASGVARLEHRYATKTSCNRNALGLAARGGNSHFGFPSDPRPRLPLMSFARSFVLAASMLWAGDLLAQQRTRDPDVFSRYADRVPRFRSSKPARPPSHDRPGFFVNGAESSPLSSLQSHSRSRWYRRAFYVAGAVRPCPPGCGGCRSRRLGSGCATAISLAGIAVRMKRFIRSASEYLG